MPLEIAVDCLPDALVAARHATRLELCDKLDRHGMTPSTDLVSGVVSRVPVPAFALIRESDDYIVDRATLDAMVASALRAAAAGAHGIVIGVLTTRGDIDLSACREIIDAARSVNAGIAIAFHRAFDDATDMSAAIAALADLGVAHTLCAGAPGLDHTTRPMQERLAAIARARDHAAGRVGIVACAGVRAPNARECAIASGGWVHSSCRVHGKFDESQAAELSRLTRGQGGHAVDTL